MASAPEGDHSSLGERLALALAEEKRTQGSLETELIKRGLMAGRGGVSRLINGKRGAHYIDPHLVSAIAKTLHVTFEWLATGEGPMRRDGRSEPTPFEQAIFFAREWGCREDAVDNVWERHRDHADQFKVFDWVDLLKAEAELLTRLGVPRPEAVVEKQLSTRRAKERLTAAQKAIIPVAPPEPKRKAKSA